MKIGLVLGKFMPLHAGHLALIRFAAARCDFLYVLLCYNDATEPIAGATRWAWLQAELADEPTISIGYTDVDLPNTSVSSRAVSAVWTDYLKTRFTDVTTFFSSEPYGKYVADYWGIAYENFDIARNNIPISGTQLREKPLTNWAFLAKAAQPFFVQKIAIVGTESTGKTTLCEQLAAHYRTNWVAEAGREVVATSAETTLQNIVEIAEKHAENMEKSLKTAQKLLFIDTDITITSSYSQFFFGEIPSFSRQIYEANRMDLFLYLMPDAPFVQDGTRLTNAERTRLHTNHLNQFALRKIPLQYIDGSYESRFAKALKIIDPFILKK